MRVGTERGCKYHGRRERRVGTSRFVKIVRMSSTERWSMVDGWWWMLDEGGVERGAGLGADTA